MIETTDSGTIIYYDEDWEFHRIDGPAIEYSNGSKHWYYHGKRHRIDGPAIIHFNVDCEWAIDGEYIDCNSQEEFEKIMKMKVFL